jgi:adenine-specific DNA-methyltransferase
MKTRARRFAEGLKQDTFRLSSARAFCTNILSSYWNVMCDRHGVKLELRQHGLSLPSIPQDARDLAVEIGAVVASFPVEDSGYLVGSIYTVMLPESMRSEMGAYYTPPPMVNRLLDLSEKAGTDFSNCTAIDPACGGGAFLAPVALRMLKHSTKNTPQEILEDISARLRGIELDPFASWITQVLLETSLLSLCVEAGQRFPQVITVGDALNHDGIGKFDLVIGNPPYGRVKLNDTMREKYARSLYGHSNLYGLFTDLALRLAKDNGVIAYLTPTSFLGGQYFKSLRKLLTEATDPVAFDFIADREGVFDDVLQETILVSYRVGKLSNDADVSLIIPQGMEQAEIEPVGTIGVPSDGSPWIIPRSSKDGAYVSVLSRMPTRLIDLGYQVSTGQLVWNRHKSQLRDAKVNGELPIIWSESITKLGFEFSAERKNHAPYINLTDKQSHLVTKRSCVLLQRTSAKEQDRRLLSAVIPQEFIDTNGGVVVENHLNIVYSDCDVSVSPEALSVVLNSEAVDRAFRCISGSVAVSAYELEALPLPSIKQIKAVEKLIKNGATKAVIETKITSFYTEQI